MGGGIFGSASYVPPPISSFSASSSLFGFGSSFPPPLFPAYKAPPIKYTAVSFPYSSKR